MMNILQVTLGLDATHALWALLALLAFTAFYTTIASTGERVLPRQPMRQ